MIDLQDKIEGMLAAHAVGDAIGAPHEFKYSKYSYTGKIQYPAEMRSQYQPTKISAIGQVTDDTEMSFALITSLIENNGKWNYSDVVLSYMKWANSKPIGMGKNTRSLLCGVKTVKGYEKRIQKMKNSKESISQSNGSLMRAHPLVILNLKTATLDTTLTNPCDVNTSTTKVYVWLLKRLIRGNYDQEEIKLLLETLTKKKWCHTEVVVVIRDVLEHHYVDVSINRGWVLHSLYTGLWCLLNFGNLRKAISKTYRFNIVPPEGKGLSDTDTNAAISGALLGAQMGLKKLKKDPFFSSNYEKIKSCDTNKGDSPRPLSYHPSNIPQYSTFLTKHFV